MRADIRALLEKQAAWPRSRVARSWNEKLRASRLHASGPGAAQEALPTGRTQEPRLNTGGDFQVSGQVATAARRRNQLGECAASSGGSGRAGDLS